MIAAGVLVAIVAVIIFQYKLPRYGPSWVGAILPLAFTAGSIYLLTKTGIHGVDDILIPLAAVLALLCAWGGALEKKEKKATEEMESIDRHLQ